MTARSWRWTTAVCSVLVSAALASPDAVARLAAQTPATPAASAAPRSPGSPADRGAELFKNTCKVCHGEAGIGGVGPALRGAKFTRPYVHRRCRKDVRAR